MKKHEISGVFLKPLVKHEMDNYRDGYGNKREWRNYNDTLNVTKFQLKPGDKVVTFRGLVKSEEVRDPNNCIGAVDNKIAKKKREAKKAKKAKQLAALKKGKKDPNIRMVKTRVKVKQKNGVIKYVTKLIAVKKAKDKTKDEDGSKIAKRHVNYLVTVQFLEMEYKQTPNRIYNQKWKVEGKDVYSRTPAISIHPAKIKCQCRDFMFTWEKSLAEQNGLWPNNKWTKYVRLTSLDEYPRRNPKEKMGYCKHVETLLTYLNDSGLIRNT